MVKEFSLSTHDIQRFYTFILLHVNRALMVIVLFISFLIAAETFQILPSSTPKALFVLLVAVVFFTSLSVMRTILIRQARTRGVLGSWQVTVSEQGVSSCPPNENKVFLPWDNLTGVLENKHHFVLFTSRSTGILLPKASFEPSEITNFIHLIHEFTTEASYAPVFNRKIFRKTNSGVKNRFFSGAVLYVVLLLVILGTVNFFTQN